MGVINVAGDEPVTVDGDNDDVEDGCGTTEHVRGDPKIADSRSERPTSC